MIKILIADDHALFRDGLVLSLEQLDSEVLILQSANYSQTLKIVQETPQIDMLLVDLDMPDKNWEEGLSELISSAPKTHVVVISATEDIRAIRKVMEKGIKGYITKSSDSKVILAALKLVLAGGTYLPPILLESIENKSISTQPNGKLTARQTEVLQYISQGLSNKQIAHEMGVSEATVKLHINAMLKALNATNRTQALVNAQNRGII